MTHRAKKRMTFKVFAGSLFAGVLCVEEGRKLQVFISMHGRIHKPSVLGGTIPKVYGYKRLKLVRIS